MARRGQSRAARLATSTSRRERLAVDDGIAPLVQADGLGQQLGAVAVGVAGDRVDEDADHARAAATGRGKRSWVGRFQWAHGAPSGV